MNQAVEAALPQVTLSTISIPRIGELWPGQGGKFIGICRGRDGAPDYLLIEHAEELPSGNWQACKDAAAALEVEGHKDFSLPDRAESALLYANAKDDHQRDWYWTSEEHASDSDYAWGQYFSFGGQGSDHKGGFSRARAVRRVVIQ